MTGVIPMTGMGTARGPILVTRMHMAADRIMAIRMHMAVDHIMVGAPLLIRMRWALVLYSLPCWDSSCLAIEPERV